jgi:hypothetical protein
MSRNPFVQINPVTEPLYSSIVFVAIVVPRTIYFRRAQHLASIDAELLADLVDADENAEPLVF